MWNQLQVALNEPSLPARTFGLLCKRRHLVNNHARSEGRPKTHQVATDSKAVGAAFPVGALVAGLVLAVAEDLVGLLLCLLWELLVEGAGVDEDGDVRLGLQRLSKRVSKSGSPLRTIAQRRM